jgi:uncharacterized lipoprotein YbaY/heat shock protein HslJ/uncharacterized lipoprotein NlpE involved in copper resistance
MPTKALTATLCAAPLFATLAGGAHAAVLEGTATYGERMLLPPGATFEAVLEDISRADAPAVELGRVTRTDPGAPPFGFAIDYDAEDIDPRLTYAVRAQVRGPGGLMFTTDTVAPVLTRDAPDTVELMMIRVADHGDAGDAVDSAPRPIHGLDLPTQFSGTLPCADCDGIVHHLDLLPGQGFHLQRTWLGRDTPLSQTDRGRWHLDPANGGLVLADVADGPIRWQVTGPESLRLLAQDGSPILSDLPYDLTADPARDPVPVAGAMTGAFVYFADAALFEDCRTGLRVPVATEGDYLALERAYLDARAEPASEVLVTVQGDIALRPPMEGPDRPILRVDRLLGLWPDETCDRNRAQAGLVNTYWRLDRLDDGPVTPVPDATEPHMILLPPADGQGIRVAGTAGCNRMMGGVDTGANSIAFGQMAMTMMACPPPLDALERDFAAALEQSRGWQVAGQTLILTDEHDAVTALFRAVYLP